MVAVDGFPFHQRFAHGFHFVAVFAEDFVGNGILLVQNAAHFGIHVLLRFLGNILRTGNAASQEHFALVFRIHHHAHAIAHAVARNHIAGDLRGAFKVVGCAGGNASHKNILGDAPAKQNRQLAQHLVFIHRNAIALGQLPSQAQRAPARHNGYFVHRVGKRQAFRHNRVPRFVVSRGAFFVFVHHHAAAFRAHVDFVFRVFKIALIHLDFVAAACKQRGFVHQIRQIRAREPRRATRQRSQIHALVQRHFLRVHFQNLLAPANIGQRHHHLAVKPPGALQRGV